MAFDTTVQEEIPNIGSGEISTAGAHNETAYDNFVDGLVIGRMAQMKAGVLSNLDGTATPILPGVVLRAITKAIGSTTYDTTGQVPDEHSNVGDFGRMTIDVTDAAVPTFGAPVYVINAAGADAGKATQNSGAAGALLVANVTFFKSIKTGVWEISLKQLMV